MLLLGIPLALAGVVLGIGLILAGNRRATTPAHYDKGMRTELTVTET